MTRKAFFIRRSLQLVMEKCSRIDCVAYVHKKGSLKPAQAAKMQNPALKGRLVGYESAHGHIFHVWIPQLERVKVAAYKNVPRLEAPSSMPLLPEHLAWAWIGAYRIRDLPLSQFSNYIHLRRTLIDEPQSEDRSTARGEIVERPILDITAPTQN